VVIEARGIEKSFRIPQHRVDSLKERALHPFARVEYRELRALDGISFDVHQGEFFGIVGRNGSGKSSLLKVLASIYRADAGTVRMAGRLAPFIELGVGFNPELTARDNGVLNGVLMGLSKREARRRLDAVLDFAELGDFVDLKLKNYSSGMMVRLAFAVMVQADADIMLIDEVLAVGDASFAQKCMDVFQERRRAGRTIVLVTHDMTTVQELCDRAMLLHDGELAYIGDPEETSLRYLRLNFGGSEGQDPTAVPDLNARVVHARLEDAAGERIDNVEEGTPIVLDVLIEARRDLAKPSFWINVVNEDGVLAFGLTRTLEGQEHDRVPAGGRVRLSGSMENRLVPGRYHLDCWVRRNRDQGDLSVQGIRLLDFVVYGTGPRRGVVSVRADFEAVAEPGADT
jgi:ABC-type polysaccharide/polyol phosphate transport system ATPase subunit